jgi:uncharacterized membrane protein
MPPVSTTRPLTEEERALLRQPSPKLFGWWTGVVSALCVFVLAFLVALLASPWLPPAAILPAATAAGALAAAATYASVQRRERRRLREQGALVARELAAGYVNCTTYTITDAVAVEEHEDEGLSYYVLLDDGRTLFLSGQYLYEPADEDGFPWAAFEVVRVPIGGWVLRMVRHGPALTPSHARAPFSDAEYASGAVPRDGTIALRDFQALKTPGG